MRATLKYFNPLFAVGATAAIVLAAPVAASAQAASTQQSCVTLGSTQNQCQSPGNAQIYDAPPQVDYFPYAGGAT